MSFTSEVSAFMETLGPFYEPVEEDEENQEDDEVYNTDNYVGNNSQNIKNIKVLSNKLYKTHNNTSCSKKCIFAKSNNAQCHVRAFFDHFLTIKCAFN